MPGEDFDIQAAVSEVGNGLGLGLDSGDGGGGADDLDLAGESRSNPPAGDPPPISPPAPPPVGDPPAGTTPPVLPKGWKSEVTQKFWATLPPEVQAEVLRREEDAHAGLTQYKENAAFGKQFRDALAPYQEFIRTAGFDPAQQVSRLMQAHHTLSNATPEQRLDLFRSLAGEYGVDLSAIGAAADSAPFVDPAVQALQKDIQALQSKLAREEATRSAEVRQNLEKEIQAFAADPKNADFETVHEDMAALIKSGLAKDLADAYQQAIWRNPVTRAKEISRQQAEAEAAAKKAAEEHAKAARQATSSNVRAKPKSGTPTSPVGTLEDTLSETLASIRSRTS